MEGDNSMKAEGAPPLTLLSFTLLDASSAGTPMDSRAESSLRKRSPPGPERRGLAGRRGESGERLEKDQGRIEAGGSSD